jgi:ribosomal protein L3
MIGILGRKLGMTQIFEGDGRAIPVTVIAMAMKRLKSDSPRYGRRRR